MEVCSTSKKKMSCDDGGQNYEYYINGVNVKFPVKAYPTQITMMNKILQGLERKQNCLLESPTGSGKSLSLLCSCLSWQAAEKERIAAAAVSRDCSSKEKQIPETIEIKEDMLPMKEDKVDGHKGDFSDGDEDDFLPRGMKLRRSTNISFPELCKQFSKDAKKENNCNNDQTPISGWSMELKRSPVNDAKSSPNEVNEKSKTNAETTEKVPKIYFGTRTHKQISQIVHELQRTVYKNVKMSILGSREYLCIHPKVSKGKDKNEECKKLLKGVEGQSCRYRMNSNLFIKLNVRQKHNLNVAWDIEDLVTAGKKIKGCPYFGARELTRGAEIVFCPYNYLINPLIRSQMMINLKDQIVVLDEAHNIEDSAREAASVILTVLQIEETRDDLKHIIHLGITVDTHTCLLMLCEGLLSWIDNVKDQLEKRGFEDEVKVWTGKEIVQMLYDEEKFRLTPASFRLYKEQLQIVTTAEQEANTGSLGENDHRINTKSLSCLSSLILVLGKLLDQDNDFAADYKVALCRTAVLVQGHTQTPGGWKKRNKSFSEKVWTYQLNLWCLNPAVVFSDIGQQARSIIVTSGTLSPMASFSSELGVKFPISLEANHVIADNQVWVGTLSVGPRNDPINASFKYSETYSFQDNVGSILLHISKVIPKGLLCFFPSYSMLDKLVKRWKSTKIWDQLSLCKVVLTEPRGSEKQEFNETLKYFYECVHATATTANGVLDGALLLAVCRGKISEGIDFSDDNARAVLTVGIPFPNIKDTQVDLKKKYNNKHCALRGLLNGNEWYEVQAFRALNQALGRCIRHKNDWGALLMIDERFSKSPKYRKNLSKWIRSKLQHFNDFQVCLSSIAQFSDERTSDIMVSNIDENAGRIQVRENNVDLTRSVKQSTISSEYPMNLKDISFHSNDQNHASLGFMPFPTPEDTESSKFFNQLASEDSTPDKMKLNGKIQFPYNREEQLNGNKPEYYTPIHRTKNAIKQNKSFVSNEKKFDIPLTPSSIQRGRISNIDFKQSLKVNITPLNMQYQPKDISTVSTTNATDITDKTSTPINQVKDGMKRRFSFRNPNCPAKRPLCDRFVNNPEEIVINSPENDFDDINNIKDDSFVLDIDSMQTLVDLDCENMGEIADEEMSMLSTQVLVDKRNFPSQSTLNESYRMLSTGLCKKTKFMYPVKSSSADKRHFFNVNDVVSNKENINAEMHGKSKNEEIKLNPTVKIVNEKLDESKINYFEEDIPCLYNELQTSKDESYQSSPPLLGQSSPPLISNSCRIPDANILISPTLFDNTILIPDETERCSPTLFDDAPLIPDDICIDDECSEVTHEGENILPISDNKINVEVSTDSQDVNHLLYASSSNITDDKISTGLQNKLLTLSDHAPLIPDDICINDNNCSVVLRDAETVVNIPSNKIGAKITDLQEVLNISNKIDINISTDLDNTLLFEKNFLLKNSTLNESENEKHDITKSTRCNNLGVRRSKKMSISKIRKNLRETKKKIGTASTSLSNIDDEDFETIIDTKSEKPSIKCHSCNTVIFGKDGKITKVNLDQLTKHKLRIKNENIYEIDHCNSLIVQSKSNEDESRLKFEMNAYFDEETVNMYLPLVCKVCSKGPNINLNNGNVIGMKIMTWNNQKNTKIYLFSDMNL